MKKTLSLGLLGGVVLLISGMLLSQLFTILVPGLTREYTDTGMFRSWNDPIMSLYFLHPFILAIVLSVAWEKTKKVFTQKDKVTRVVNFALFFWLVSTVPGMFVSFATFAVSLPMILTWTISGLVSMLVMGFILEKYNR